jgi:hypothetical protein
VKKDSFKFSLNTFNAATVNIFAAAENDSNPRFCSIDGSARVLPDKTAIYEDGKKDSDEYCKLTFALKDGLLDVSSDGCEDCRMVNADGLFQIDDGTCSAAKMKSKREAFNKVYKAKKFQESVKILEDLLKTCRIQLSNPDISWLLNDLALARFKSGDKKGCLSAIADIPMGLESKLAKAVAHNKKLCSE